jgi:hypothetical protein
VVCSYLYAGGSCTDPRNQSATSFLADQWDFNYLETILCVSKIKGHSHENAMCVCGRGSSRFKNGSSNLQEFAAAVTSLYVYLRAIFLQVRTYLFSLMRPIT